MLDVIHICYPGIGGQAAVALGLATEGARSGISQGVIFYGVEPTAGQYLDLCDRLGIDHVSILKKPGVGLAARKSLRRTVAGMDPRMIISHHHDTAVTVAGAGVAPRAVRIFVEHHSNALKTAKDWILSTLAHNLSDHTVYLTESYRETVRRKTGWWFVAEKARVIANGLDLTLYRPTEAKHGGSTVIGMQGRMDTGKDFATLLRAFAGLPDRKTTVLELIGDGPDRDRLEKLASELGIAGQVKFCGFLSQEKLIERMRGWSIAVLMTMGETLSMAILEVWALRLPLVSTRVSGVADLLEHEADGMLVSASDPAALAETLTQLINTPELARRLGEAGRRRVEREFDRSKSWQRYLTLCAESAPLASGSSLNPEKIS